MRRWKLAMSTFALAALAACGGVKIAPEPELPRALIESIPAKVGLVLTAEQRNYTHSETRSGVGWSVALGTGQQQLARRMLESTFREVKEFDDLAGARAATDLQAIFEPQIEQFSFATAQETGGDYVAVTIRYRINVFAPNGERYDSLTLTGYGTAAAGGLGSSESMADATKAAMRDAAARFLTQFAATDVAKVLAGGKRIEVTAEDAMRALAASGLRIEAVPIRVSRRTDPNWRPESPRVSSPPPASADPAPSPAGS